LTLLCYLLARYGVRGIFSATRPWRIALLILIGLAGTLGGYRSSLILITAVFIFHFCLEGMWRTGLAAVLALVGAGLLVILIAFSEKMPPAVQRAFSFLPIQVSAQVLADSKGSTEWRVEMWKVVVPELPKYFWLGKGYALDPTELYLTQHAIIRGLAKNYEQALRAGTYHNGPLTVYIPLGIFGLLAFVLFVLASCRALYYNYRYGDPELQTANTLLFSVFVARTLFFFFVFGDLPTDLPTFTGLIGFGLALNGGIKKPAPVRLPGLAEVQWHRHPVLA